MNKIGKILTYLLFMSILISSTISYAIPPPTLLSARTTDADMYGILLAGANYDSSTYVDIRSTTNGTIIASILPPNITYLPETQVTTPLGMQNGMLSFRINDPTLQNLLTTQGLRIAVISPTAGYQWAGLLTLQKSAPLTGVAPFHTAYFQPARFDLFATLADDDGVRPTPREQMIKSIYNELAAMHQTGFDAVTVPIHGTVANGVEFF